MNQAITVFVHHLKSKPVNDVLELIVPDLDCPSCEGGTYLTGMGTPEEAAERCEQCGGLGKVEKLEVAA